MSDTHAPSAAAGHGHSDHHLDSHDGVSKYVWVFIALCVLTSASIFTSSPLWPFHESEKIGWAFMMAVSCTKAMLVILFFMHVKYEANWKYVLTIPAGFMSIFLILMLVPDVGMRGRTSSEERQLYMADEPHAKSHAKVRAEDETHGETHEEQPTDDHGASH